MLEQYLTHVRDPINAGFPLGSSEIWHVIRSSYFSHMGGLSVASAGSTNLPVQWPIAAWSTGSWLRATLLPTAGLEVGKVICCFAIHLPWANGLARDVLQTVIGRGKSARRPTVNTAGPCLHHDY